MQWLGFARRAIRSCPSLIFSWTVLDCRDAEAVIGKVSARLLRAPLAGERISRAATHPAACPAVAGRDVRFFSMATGCALRAAVSELLARCGLEEVEHRDAVA
jgi:hypothetical protein